MEIAFTVRHVPFVDRDRDRAVERIRRAFRRFADRIRGVDVRLTDVNGPRGGIDKRAFVEVSLVGGGRITIARLHEHTGGALAAAVDVVRSRLRKRYGERRGVPVG